MPKVKEKPCLNCNILFKPYYRNSVYCCKKCKKEHTEKLQNEKQIRICKHCKKKYIFYDVMPNWFKPEQHESGKYHGVDSSKYCSYECGIAHRQIVSKNTCKIKYGVEFTAATDNNKVKSKITKLQRYGNEHYINIEKIKKTNNLKTQEEKEQISLKIKKTKLLKYGNENYNGNKCYTKTELEKQQEKAYKTYKKNNSFIGKGQIKTTHCSLDEEKIYNILITKYPKTKFNKFIKHYGKCDFYIPELNLYIEYQGTWTHGGKPFENSAADIMKVNKWKIKNSPYYNNAIYTWTKLDVKKRNVAKELGLNWKEFFTIVEFKSWFEIIK